MRWLALTLLCLLPMQALADAEEDRDFLTTFIEDSLSNDEYQVRIDGFQGALSSQARFTTLTISDSAGAWLVVRDGQIDWNRGALLGGRVEVNRLSAAAIEMPRRPQPDSSLPDAEAREFALPDLPVSIRIDTIAAQKVSLGATVLGEAAELSLKGSMQLADGEGSATIEARRIDGRTDGLTFQGSYANETRIALIDLSFVEASGGIAGNLLGLPGAPSIELGVNGNGPVDDFVADLTLSTDGTRRLAGQVQLVGAVASAGQGVERQFRADLGGDVTALFAPHYRPFFGSDLRVRAEGVREASGRLRLSMLHLDADSVDLDGVVTLAPGGRPELADVTLRIADPSGGTVVLPIGGPDTEVSSVLASIDYDSAKGEGWTATAAIDGLRRNGIAVGQISLDASGRVPRTAAAFGATFEVQATGIAPDDPALATALGTAIGGSGILHWQQGAALSLSRLDLSGAGIAAKGSAKISGLETGFAITTTAEAKVADLSRFSGLAKRNLAGAATVDVQGSGAVLERSFDGTATLQGQDLSLGQRELDSLLSGASELSLSARRDTTGTQIRALSLKAATLSAEASGQITSQSVDLLADLDFSDLSVLGSGYRGALAGEARLSGQIDAAAITLDATGRGLQVGQVQADRLLAGDSALNLRAHLENGVVKLDDFTLANPQLSAKATGEATAGQRDVQLDARLVNMGLLVPQFPGAATLAGSLTEDATGYRVELQGQGPGASRVTVTGRADRQLKALDLRLTGGAQSALANAFIDPFAVDGPATFDLTLRGPARLSSLAGRVELAGARFAAVEQGVTLSGISARADLQGGRASLSADAAVEGGGRITLTGPVTLDPPNAAELRIRLDNARLRDPDLYDTRVSGDLTVIGPLQGGAEIAGQLTLDQTEIRVPSTGFGATGELIDLRHIHERPPSRLTRARAGLIGGDAATSGAGRSGPVFGVNVRISAPNRIFVRGRGLDAELGGALTVTGRSDALAPGGQFDLVRGRLDILGKRFVLDDGLIRLQGEFVPYILFSASSENDGVTSTIAIEGDARNPDISFSSSPELPEDEVVAQLLFGRGLTNLSAFQAAQLASAVATLAGKSGEGIIGKLRKGFGLDDLDLTTDDEGNASLKVGKYLSDNIYTDVTIDGEGTSQIELNLDISKSVTARGTVSSDGNTGIGIFVEKDY